MPGDDGNQAPNAGLIEEPPITYRECALVKIDGDRTAPGQARPGAEQIIDVPAQCMVFTTFGAHDGHLPVRPRITAS